METLFYTVIALVVGFAMGRSQRRPEHSFQNDGESRLSRTIRACFNAPNYHLLNHVTLRMNDGTTQVDHILVSRFGVFVMETKNYNGWIFANAGHATWTQVMFNKRSQFQNPIFQNLRHVRAVREVLDFLPPDCVRSVVVFTGDAEFKTEVPPGVVTLSSLADHIREHATEVMSTNRVQFCVGRLETIRLAITNETDVEHVESLKRRHAR